MRGLSGNSDKSLQVREGIEIQTLQVHVSGWWEEMRPWQEENMPKGEPLKNPKIELGHQWN